MKIKTGIIGGSGYTGGELIRLLLNHPKAVIDFVFSTTKAGHLIAETHQDLLGITDIKFSNALNTEVDVVFLCLGHGNSTAFLKEHQFSAATTIIDLSNDFRLEKDAVLEGKEFVYGLPELQKNTIQKAKYIANPGCFATAIQLALLPLAKAKKLQNEVHINAVTGSTGAGVKPSTTTHFSWRNNNVSWYKPFTHQHLGEIKQSLKQMQGTESELFFMPQRGNFARGIFVTAYTRFEDSLEAAQKLYSDFYALAPFTHVSSKEIHLKQVVNTNQCHIHLHKYENTLLITSAIDNLLKGASGQAIQNMNIIFGLEETEGLQLKGSFF
ncbi:N-acetyl-gamma-glutamyl-phosphate reductase [Sungkyunkwania multivorans]|uniref:N-acetyl-gamma-glutamyl-phosphate reductase n=1 Tax=Sungkyunkwania multivorans TaxID=1173618 RepID=A0ABW3CSY8_9FLAO